MPISTVDKSGILDTVRPELCEKQLNPQTHIHRATSDTRGEGVAEQPGREVQAISAGSFGFCDQEETIDWHVPQSQKKSDASRSVSFNLIPCRWSHVIDIL